MHLVRVDLNGDTISATVVGPSSGAPDAESLAGRLAGRLDRGVTADLRLIVEEPDTAISGPWGAIAAGHAVAMSAIADDGGPRSGSAEPPRLIRRPEVRKSCETCRSRARSFVYLVSEAPA